MWKWFKGCKYAEQGKELYRNLVKNYHTDNGTQDDTIIKEINSEFTEWWKSHKHLHFSTEKQTEYTQDTQETAEEFIDIIRNLSTLSGIKVEQCGSWLWIGGNTYPVREQLLSFGCKYSHGKKMWYWASGLDNHKYRGTKTMKQIRNMYGSKSVNLNSHPLLD